MLSFVESFLISILIEHYRALFY